MSKPNVEPVALNILGKEYKIVCAPDEQEALVRSAQALDKQMRRIRDTGKVAGADRIAVLAALNLAHDSSSAGNKNTAEPNDISNRINELRQKIEKALENP